MERHSEKYFIFQLFPILFFAPYFVKSKNTLKHFLGNTVFSVKFSFTVYRPERKVVITLKVKVLVTQSCLTFCNPMDCSPLRLLCPWNFPGQNTGVGSRSLSPGALPDQGMESGFPALQADSFLSETAGKPI